jgi:nitronate monooxygenase
MLHTYLTTAWHMRYPIISAPMAYVGRGRLARAVSKAGGLGMIGIGSKDSVDYITQEAAAARGDDDERFGLGLMAWALETRPELLDGAIRAKPFLLSISFGSPAPYVDAVHRHHILVATQVHSRAEASEAARAGVDLIVVQGAEAGGHTGQVSTLTLLQSVIDIVQVPVIAAGGIASPRGVAAALVAGAEGVWVGTRFLGAVECDHLDSARQRIFAAQETDTVLTRVFDIAQGLPWPPQYPGRALRNQFTQQWHPHLETSGDPSKAHQQLAEAAQRKDYDVANIYAGEAVGLVSRQQSAAEILRELGDGAEKLLKERYHHLLDG